MSTVAKVKSSLDDFKGSMVDAIDSGVIKQIIPPLEHYHTAQQYGRRIFVKGGTAVITKVHKSEHITVALKGSCTVLDEDGVKTEVVAPSVFITRPGTRRAVYAHDDVEWLTVHACEEQDLDKIEAALVCTSLEEADQEDYKKILVENNVTEKWARLISENPRTQTDTPPDELAHRDVYLSSSLREGIGVFANKNFAVGDRIGTVRIKILRTPIGRYTNHSISPNCELLIEGDNVAAYAVRPLTRGQEVTVCYRLARKVNVEASRLLEKPS